MNGVCLRVGNGQVVGSREQVGWGRASRKRAAGRRHVKKVWGRREHKVQKDFDLDSQLVRV